MPVLSVNTKTVTSQSRLFSQSLEQGTDNPRVGNCVLTAISLNSEGSDLIESFLCLKVLCYGEYSCLFDLTSGKGWKSMLTLLVFYLCQPQAKPNEYEN